MIFYVTFKGLPGPLNNSITFDASKIINQNSIAPNITNFTYTAGSFNQFF